MDRVTVEDAVSSARGGVRPAPARWEKIAPRWFVCALVVFSAWNLAPSVGRAWFYRSDEYPIAGEIIRFLHLDFQQHYFDLPETPLMFACAALWRIVYAGAWITGIAPRSAGIDDFTFHHLPLLIGIARASSLVAGLIGIILVYLLASRLTNAAGGCVAAMITAMCPIYAWSQSTIRPEPAVVCLLILAVFSLERALTRARDAREEARWIFSSGLLAGLAAAMRFHSITATLPMLALILVSSGGNPPEYPGQMRHYWRRTLAFTFAGAVAAIAAIRSGILPRSPAGRALLAWWPKALDDFAILLALGAALIFTVWVLARWQRTAWIGERILHPRMGVLLAGSIAGAVAGTPTILWRQQNFFESIQMYTTSYTDVERMGWPLAKHFAWLFEYYLKAIAPDPLSTALLAAGAAVILLRRDRRLLPFLLTGALFFVARPISILPFPHQMLPWLPVFAIIAGSAAAAAFDGLGRLRHASVVRPAAFAALLIAMASTMKLGPRVTALDARKDELRMQSIAQATDWIHRNAEPDSAVAISYYCFNSDVFFTWMKFLDVPFHASADTRTYMIWWGERSVLRGLHGYACATPLDVDNIKRKLDLRSPGEGSDPFTDAGFERAAMFGRGASEVDVFRFDFSSLR